MKNNEEFDLWEYGTCWVTAPVIDKLYTHKARRHKVK